MQRDEQASDVPDYRAEVLLLRRQVDSLQRRLVKLQRFRDAVFKSAEGDLQRWALHHGLQAPTTAPPTRVPLSQEVRTALASSDPPRRPQTTPSPARARQPVLRIERRNTARHTVRHPVRFAATGRERTTAATLVQVSPDAFVISTALPPPLGTRVACGLYVGEEHELELVLVKGRVARVIDEPDSRGFVMRIDDLTLDASHLADRLAGTVVIEPQHVRDDENTAKVRQRRARLAR